MCFAVVSTVVPAFLTSSFLPSPFSSPPCGDGLANRDGPTQRVVSTPRPLMSRRRGIKLISHRLQLRCVPCMPGEGLSARVSPRALPV